MIIVQRDGSDEKYAIMDRIEGRIISENGPEGVETTSSYQVYGDAVTPDFADYVLRVHDVDLSKNYELIDPYADDVTIITEI